MEERPIVLVGMMGAGKSAVGRALAKRLGRPFVDADEALEDRAGHSVAEVFAIAGDEAFRDLEASVLDELLGHRPPPVVAAGGGVVVRPSNRRALRERATVVWLEASVAELLQRVGSGRGRPLLAEDPGAVLDRLQVERGPWYAEVAHLTIDTAGRRPDELADHLAERLVGSGAATTGERR